MVMELPAKSTDKTVEDDSCIEKSQASPQKSSLVGSVGVGTANRQIPIVCPGHTRPLAELQFCCIKEENNRVLLISACHDKLPMVRDGITGNWIGTFMGHKGAVWCCRLDNTCNLAATASGDYSVQIWDAITGKSLYVLQHNHIVKTCDFSFNSKYLATGGHEGILRIYSVLQPNKEPLVIKITNDEPSGTSTAGSSKTNAITITKINWYNNTTIITGCSDGNVRFYEINDFDINPTQQPSHVLRTGSSKEIRDMELSLQNNILSLASSNSVYFYDLLQKILIKTYTMPIHFNDEGGVSLHPDCTKFIVGGSDLWVRVYDYNTGTELECLKGHHGPIRCVRFSPDGSMYATGSEDGTIRLWTS